MSHTRGRKPACRQACVLQQAVPVFRNHHRGFRFGLGALPGDRPSGRFILRFGGAGSKGLAAAGRLRSGLPPRQRSARCRNAITPTRAIDASRNSIGCAAACRCFRQSQRSCDHMTRARLAWRAPRAHSQSLTIASGPAACRTTHGSRRCESPITKHYLPTGNHFVCACGEPLRN
jgi:hypothetical protein